jgi:hypothetical protein
LGRRGVGALLKFPIASASSALSPWFPIASTLLLLPPRLPHRLCFIGAFASWPVLLMPPWPPARRRPLRFRLRIFLPAPPSPALRGIVIWFLNPSMNWPALINTETIQFLAGQVRQRWRSLSGDRWDFSEILAGVKWIIFRILYLIYHPNRGPTSHFQNSLKFSKSQQIILQRARESERSPVDSSGK